jgi:AraC-like DNA-binding protein/GNAT superfamily N-acetyltransferase
MESIKLLNQAITHIESCLTAPLSVETAAAVVGYSRFHFSRTFAAVTGVTPVAYVRKRRLSEAACELATTSRRILDIALDYQFQSQEAFTRSFKQEFGLNPAAYRRRGQRCRLFSRITLRASHLLYPGKGLALVPPLLRPTQTPISAGQLLYRPAEGMVRPTLDTPTNKTNSVKIRPAHRQDLPALCRLYHILPTLVRHGIHRQLHRPNPLECFDATWFSLTLEKRIDAVAIAIWVAEVNGQVVGLVEVSLHEEENQRARIPNRYGYVQSLAVDQRWRGREIGKQLLAAAEHWSRTQGALELRLAPQWH